ncbi:hypothetical protein QUA35_24525 [Microcoleus sp. N9_B2]|uniref:hypothetical protein n=1 Tax=unclassified Microcoleus TaxID=2642155 RepID=UPI002FD644B7
MVVSHARSQYPILQNYLRAIALQFNAIALAGFYPYCYAKSAIFVKGDRASKMLTRKNWFKASPLKARN